MPFRSIIMFVRGTIYLNTPIWIADMAIPQMKKSDTLNLKPPDAINFPDNGRLWPD